MFDISRSSSPHCVKIPAFFTPNYDEYIRSVCFVQNTYYVKHSDKIPKIQDRKKESEILYYQWIPFLLIVKAFVFYIPRLSWNIFGMRSGIQISDLVESAYDYRQPTTAPAQREMCLNYVVDTIDRYCDDYRRHRDARSNLSTFQRILSTACCMSGKYSGSYLVVLYMTTKVLYLTVALFQIYILSTMLGSNFAFYGVLVLDRMFRGQLERRLLSRSARHRAHSFPRSGIHWDTESRLFPKTTLCDFTIREFGHPKLAHEYTVPCVLPLNLFNQQMFTFLYFWYLIVILINIADFFLWLNALTPGNRRSFIHKRLHSKKYPLRRGVNERANVLTFINNYLEADGFFLLSLIKENSSDYVAAEIVHRLYAEKFLPRYAHDLPLAASTIYDEINGKGDDSQRDPRRRRHLCAMIC